MCPGKKIVNSITCSNIKILCLGSFLCIALHFLNVYNFKCNYGACFKKWCLFSPSELIRGADGHFLTNEPGHRTFFSFLELGNYFPFLSNNFKPIFGVGKGKNVRNVDLKNSHKCNCHDIIGIIWISRRYCCS